MVKLLFNGINDRTSNGVVLLISNDSGLVIVNFGNDPKSNGLLDRSTLIFNAISGCVISKWGIGNVDSLK